MIHAAKENQDGQALCGETGITSAVADSVTCPDCLARLNWAKAPKPASDLPPEPEQPVPEPPSPIHTLPMEDEPVAQVSTVVPANTHPSKKTVSKPLPRKATTKGRTRR
jgi:hypothetical protein